MPIICDWTGTPNTILVFVLGLNKISHRSCFHNIFYLIFSSQVWNLLLSVSFTVRGWLVGR